MYSVLTVGRTNRTFLVNLKEKDEKREEKEFVEPELVKHEEKLDEMTMQPVGTPDGFKP